MDTCFVDILTLRKEVLVSAVRWTSSLTAALLKHHVITIHDVNKIEGETESRSKRVRLLLAALPEQDNASFHAFTQALEEAGHHEPAIILARDAQDADDDTGERGAAQSEGDDNDDEEEEEERWSMSRYIDVLEGQLLAPLEDPDLDDQQRIPIVRELRTRLHTIARFHRLSVQRKEQLRRSLLQLGDPASTPPPSTSPPSVLGEGGMDRYHAHEGAVDMELLERVEEYVEKLQVQVKQLQSEVKRREQALMEKQLQWKTDENGKKVYVRAEALPKCGEEFIHLSREELTHIMRMLKPHRRARYSNPVVSSTSPADLVEDVEYLVEHVVVKLKERLVQTSSRITELEREKATVFAALREDNLERQMREVVMEKFGQVMDERDYLETEVASLRKNIESLASEHRNTMHMVYEGSERTSSRGSPVATSPSLNTLRKEGTSQSARTRRVSAPIRPGSATSSSGLHVNDKMRSTSTEERRAVQQPLSHHQQLQQQHPQSAVEGSKKRPSTHSNKQRRVSAVKRQ